MTFKEKVAEFFGTVVYVGQLPSAPGTWGSLVALLAWYILIPHMSTAMFLLINLGLFFIGIIVSDILIEAWGEDDPSAIVIDEWVGQWLALYIIPHHLGWGFVTFFIFRIFDIFKPGPVKIMDDFKSGIGVMMDDVIAGILALLVTNSIIIYFS